MATSAAEQFEGERQPFAGSNDETRQSQSQAPGAEAPTTTPEEDKTQTLMRLLMNTNQKMDQQAQALNQKLDQQVQAQEQQAQTQAQQATGNKPRRWIKSWISKPSKSRRWT